MTLLANSSKERRWPVRVLIYGQSITGSKALTEMIGADLKTRFPFAEVTVENRSIGGFGAESLVRTSVHDLYPYYPDLLIFHVYGGEMTGELERIISNVRRYTTTDILMFNHHQNRDQTSINENSAAYWRYLAHKYDCELVDVSREWPRYLRDNRLEPGRLLRDNVHPNPEGYAFLTTLIGRHLTFNPLLAGGWSGTVRTYEARRALDEGASDEIIFTGDSWRSERGFVVGTSPNGTLKLTFEGNRVDVITRYPKELGKPGSARVLIDGRPPSGNPLLYAITRPTTGVGTWWPAIRRVSCEKPLLLEDWTLRITEINEDASKFRFEVSGSKTGPDGSGTSEERFVSRSGRVVIEPRDFWLAQTKKQFKTDTPVGFQITWSVVPRFVDQYQPPAIEDRSRVYQTILAQGLENGTHTLIPLVDCRNYSERRRPSTDRSYPGASPAASVARSHAASGGA